MAKFDKSVLEKYGITGTTEVLYNPSYEVLFNEETKEGLTGFDKGQETELGAINVMTGVYTGRSPKDKFIVDDENSHDTVWWTYPPLCQHGECRGSSPQGEDLAAQGRTGQHDVYHRPSVRVD